MEFWQIVKMPTAANRRVNSEAPARLSGLYIEISMRAPTAAHTTVASKTDNTAENPRTLLNMYAR
jgi:hypothetical protein